jgi:hypothetical protein
MTARPLDDGVRGGRLGQGKGATDGDLQPSRGEPIGYFLERLPVGLHEDTLNMVAPTKSAAPYVLGPPGNCPIKPGNSFMRGPKKLCRG